MYIKPRDAHSFRLTNDGALELFFLGCGSAFAKTQYQNNIIIIKGDSHLVVDFGNHAMLSCDALNLSFKKLDNFLITHTHADHTGGLEEIALMNRYFINRRPNIYIDSKFRNILWEQSLRGGLAHSEHEGDDELQLKDYFNICEPEENSEKLPRDGHRFKIGSIDIQTFRTHHFPQQSYSWFESFYSVGLLIDKKILFTGDTLYDPDLVQYFNAHYNIDYIFHDVQFFVGGIHAGFDEIIRLPSDVRQKTYLMHYPDNWVKFIEEVEAHKMKFAKQWHSYIFD